MRTLQRDLARSCFSLVGWRPTPHPFCGSRESSVAHASSRASAMAGNAALLKVNQQNMKIINDACNGQIETQMLVMDFIEQYKQKGMNLQECMKGRSEKKKAKLCPAAGLAHAADDEAEFVIPEGAMLPKNCRKYAGWKVGLLEELFQYCESGTFSITKKQLDSQQLARQILEFAFGLKAGLADGKSDSITTLARGGVISKKEVFDALKSLYGALGRRLRNFVIVEGDVHWPTQGIYRIERLQASDENHKTIVYNRFMDRRAEIPDDLVRGMAVKDLPVEQNFSMDGALIFVATGESLILSSLFPRIKQMRALRRRLSDHLGVTGDEEHGGGASPPPAKKHRPSDEKHAPKAAADASTPRVPSPPAAAVASTAGGVGVAATPAHPPLEASGDEGSDGETLGRDDWDE